MKRVVFHVIMCLIGLVAFSQDQNLKLINPLPVSPQAAAIAKYTDLPVSLNSGLVDITIPITLIKTGAISYPLSLSYHTSGVKVEEIASNVGLGWTLNYTGLITRQVRGLPDDASNGWWNDSSEIELYARGHMTPENTEAFKTEFRTADIDGQPDIYYYSLPGGQSGKFFMDTGNNWTCLPQTNLKIEMGDNMLSWKITTDQGIQYFFTAIELTSSNTNGTGFTGNTGWYLTKIIDPASNEVDLTYTGTSANYITKGVETYKVNITGAEDAYSAGVTNNVISSWKIKSINWREGAVNFFYANSGRQDITSTDTALSRIEIVNNQNNLVNEFRLYTSYSGRLTLDSVQQSGLGASLPPYKFEYHPGGIDDRMSNNQDYWGYYNGKLNNIFVEYFSGPGGTGIKEGADRSIDSNYTQGEILQKIHYATGGAATFEYEPNRYAKFQPSHTSFSSVPFGGITGDNSDRTTNPDAFLFTFNESIAISNADATVDGTAIVMSKLTSNCDVPGGTCRITVTLYNPDNSVNRILTNDATLNLAPGTYRLHAEIETELAVGSIGMAGHISSFDEELYLGTPKPAGLYDQLAGGVRIKRIITDDGTKVTGIKEYYYNAFGQNYSSGSIGAYNNLPQYFRTESVVSGVGSNIRFSQYNVYSSTSNYPLITSGNSYVTYANVESVEKDGANNNNGKSDFYYTTFADHPDGNDALSYPFPPGDPFDYGRGLLVRQDDFKSNSNGSFSLLRQKMNNYVFLGDSTMRGVDGLVAGGTTIYSNADATDEMINLGYTWAPFKTTTQVTYLQSDTSIQYDMNDQENKLITINTYDYKSRPVLLMSQLSTASNGDIKKTSIRYAGDFSPFGFISAMQQANAIATPIETITSRILPSSQEVVTAGAISSYKPSQLTRDRVYTVQSAAPVPVGQFSTTMMNSSGNLQMDNSFQSLLQFDRYDPFGNIVEEQKTGDLMMSYIWDYNGTSPVAGTKNADSASVAYTSFESAGSGNWVIGPGTLDSFSAVTGRRFFESNGTITKSGLNPATAYYVTYWTQKGSPFSISGTLSGYPAKGKTVIVNNGTWTLYVHKVAGQSSIMVSGTGSIDELRLYPATAQMTTYTYTPLVGMTSQCDAGNRITYYEYDGLARLKRIRDQDYNILKTFAYQYQVKTGFSSDAESGVFTRNCTAGGSPSSVTYIVAAGTYQSLISQEDANAKAQNDVNINGQGFADAHGTCTFSSVLKTNTFTRSCAPGGTGSSVVYSVAPGTYHSIISQGDADAQATSDLSANGPGFANANGTCTWHNATLTASFARNNCGTDYTTISIPESIPAGTYSSLISQVDADQQARNAAQNDANTRGECIQLVNITCVNNLSAPDVNVTFTNTSTGQQYSYDISAAGGAVGSVPVGTYNVTLTSSHGYIMGFLCGLFSGGTSVSLFNVDVNSCNQLFIDDTGQGT